MNCPRCHQDKHKVIDTTATDANIRRRRECELCGFRWNTFETGENVAGELATLKDLLRPVTGLLQGKV